MQQFDYTIQSTAGICGGLANRLSKEVSKYQSQIVMRKGRRTANPAQIGSLKAICVRCGDRVTVIIDGVDEEWAADRLEIFFARFL